jgi:putative methionine-R-sulfoxide reductase with GAF domain
VKTYRSTREVLSEIERVLSQNTYSLRALSPLQSVVDTLQAGRHYLSTTIYLVAGDRLVLQASGGQDGAPQEIRGGDGFVGKVAETGTAYLARDVNGDSAYRKYFSETRAALAVPVQTPSRVWAVLNVESDREEALGWEDQVLLKEVGSRLGVFLAGRGKYLIHRWRIADAIAGAKIKTQPKGNSGQSARSATAGTRTVK